MNLRECTDHKISATEKNFFFIIIRRVVRLINDREV
jgi:hypothetical protein